LSTLALDLPEAFAPLLAPARYKGAWGGRGSGKSHFFAQLLIARCLRSKTDAVCVREIQKSLKQSVKKLLETKIEALGVSSKFSVTETEIRGPHGSLIIFQGMQDHTAESIKSLEDFDIAWVEEAQSLSEHSLTLLRPTLRKPGSELWFSWNPRRKSDPVDALLRGPTPPTGAVVVRANWSDNPWFPAELEVERTDCLRDDPEQYDHIWDGGYAKVTKGAYYAKDLLKAKAEGRIGHVAADPLMTIRAIWDIGGTGAKADACSIWIAQFIAREIRVLNHYTAQGQPLAAHVKWLRDNGYAKALCILPHDGETKDRVFDVSYESALRDAEFEVIVVPNQGRGAAMMRVEAGRRLFPRIWFNEATTEAGREALGHYHEKLDETRQIGLGPDHDWSSHDADSFGLMCVAYEEPRVKREAERPRRTHSTWMGGR
jgi:phage terminase large subunit